MAFHLLCHRGESLIYRLPCLIDRVGITYHIIIGKSIPSNKVVLKIYNHYFRPSFGIVIFDTRGDPDQLCHICLYRTPAPGENPSPHLLPLVYGRCLCWAVPASLSYRNLSCCCPVPRAVNQFTISQRITHDFSIMFYRISSLWGLVATPPPFA